MILFRKFESFLAQKLVNVLPDSLYLKLMFHRRVGYYPNLKNPRTYNEKLQWLKLHNQRPEYTEMVDKLEAKKYVASKIGEEYIIPTLGVWNSVEEIDWNSLPNQFVLKVTGDSGGIVVCSDKNFLDVDSAKKKLIKGWGKNYYKYNKEYPYRDIKPRIIAEQYMVDESGYELKDYKFFCFNGEPKYLFVATDRQNKGEETKFDFFDLDWNHIPVVNGHPNNPQRPQCPENFEEMIRIAKELSAKIPHVRVDLYNINGKIYFGELTFFHWSGMVAYEPIEWDYKFGEYIRI